MKKFYTILALLFTTVLIAQTDTTYVGVLTPDKDTLYLADNDIGREIKVLWDNGTYGENPPVIVFTSEATLPEKKRMYARKQ